ncbi:Protein archease [Acanthocheilonema viteae]
MVDAPVTAVVKYEYLDHTADIQLHGWGNTLEEAMEQTLISLYAYMTEISTVSAEYSFDLFASGIDMVSLMARLLDEALFAFSTEPFFIGRIARVIKIDREKFEVQVRCWGESFDLNRHPQGTEIKAITYSNMQVNESSNRTDIYVIVDI